LKSLPIDYLKIDRSFVANLLVDKGSEAIINAIIAMGSALDIKLIAEGVEQEEQAKWLSNLGCQYGQGFYFANPMPAADLEQWLTNYSVH